MIPRKTPLARGGRVKPRNAKRRTKEWTRAYGSAERVAFVAALPCAVCGIVPSENAHAKTGGVGRKGDASSVLSLCTDHHALQHTMGARSFEALYRLSLAECAERTDAAWQAYREAVA